MSVGMVMRSSRLRTLIYALVLCGMGLIVVLLSNTHSRLKNVESSHDKCQQQRDSLSAQLQVVYEHKNRIEKSLDQERTDHKHTKEEVEKQSADIKAQNEKDKLQMESRYNDLHQEHQLLQKKVQQLETELASAQESSSNLQQQKKQFQGQISSMVLEKEHLQQSLLGQTWKAKQCMEELELCRAESQHLQQRLASVSSQIWSNDNLQNKDAQHGNPQNDPNVPVGGIRKSESNAGKVNVKRQDMQANEPKSDKNNQNAVAMDSPLHRPDLPDDKSIHRAPVPDQSNVHNAAGNIQPLPQQEDHGHDDVKQNHMPQVQPPLGFDRAQKRVSDSVAEDNGNNGAGERPLGQPLPLPNRPAEANYVGLQDSPPHDIGANNLQNVLAMPLDAVNGGQPHWQAGNDVPVIHQPQNGANGKGKNALMEGLKRGPQFNGQQPMARAKDNAAHPQGEDDHDYPDDGDDDNADDQDAENARGMGIGAGGGHPFRDADFDDQDDGDGNAQNPQHQDKVEGVMVAPK